MKSHTVHNQNLSQFLSPEVVGVLLLFLDRMLVDYRVASSSMCSVPHVGEETQCGTLLHVKVINAVAKACLFGAKKINCAVVTDSTCVKIADMNVNIHCCFLPLLRELSPHWVFQFSSSTETSLSTFQVVFGI